MSIQKNKIIFTIFYRLYKGKIKIILQLFLVESLKLVFLLHIITVKHFTINVLFRENKF